MKLYDIKEEIERAIDEICVDEDTGEVVSGSANEKLQELMKMEGDAIESLALYIKNTNAEANALKVEMDSLTKRKKTKENSAKYLKAFLSEYLNSRGIPKYETPKCVLSFRKSEQVSITDHAAFLKYAKLHEELLNFKEPEPNKTAIKISINNGDTIPGAEIVTNQNLQLK